MSIRKFLDRITSTKRFTSRRPKPLQAHKYQPRFEPLEQRQLLSVSPWNADLELTSNASSNVAQTPLVLAENSHLGPSLTSPDCSGASPFELQISEVDSQSENLGKGLDAGDFYWYFDKKIPLLRLQDEIVVGLNDSSADKAAMTALTENGGLLHGWEISNYLDSGQAVYKPSTVSSNFEEGLSSIASAESVAWSSPVFCLADSGEQIILGDEIIVALGGGVDPTEFFASGYSSYSRLSGTPDQYVAVVEQGGGVTALELSNSLKDDPRVQWASPNFYCQITTASVPNDPMFSNQWNMNNTGQFDAKDGADPHLARTPGDPVDGPGAWDETTGNSEITIAVLDDGVQLDHPDLYLNMWLNQGEIPEAWLDGNPANGELQDTDADQLITFHDLNAPANAAYVSDRPTPDDENTFIDPGDLLVDARWANSDDADGNGYVDDLCGWDFRNNDNNANPVDDLDNHGTAVAGIAGAEGNNSAGVSGAAQNVGIMSIKYSQDDGDPETPVMIWADDVVGAVYYAAGRTADGLGTWKSADILNCSWHLDTEIPALAAAFDWAHDFGRDGLGAPAFVASGNGASGYVERKADFTFQAGHTYQAAWQYAKDLTGSAGNDTAWLGQVEFPDGSIETFDSPTGWTTGGNANWVVVDEADDPSHNYGTSQNMLRAGTISDGEESVLFSPVFSGIGDLIFKSWTSCAAPDGLRLYISVDGGNFGLVEVCVGNPTVETSVNYPANLASTIAVGASTDWDFRSDYSQYGSELDFVAPSNGGFGAVTTTDRTGTTTDGMGDAGYAAGDYTTTFGGTSAAAPLAAGIAALMLSKNPNLSAEQVRTVLQDTAVQIGGVTYTADGRNDYYGHGRVNAAAALGMIHVFTVDSTLDNPDANVGDGDAEDASGNTTLRAAIQEANANPGDLYTIILPDGYYRLDETGTGEDSALTGDLDITGNITIRSINIGESTISANRIDRVFDVHNGGNLTLLGVGVEGGETPSTGSLYDQSGGGVRVNTGGNLLVKQSRLCRNIASWDGGAISVGGMTSPGSNAEIVDTQIYGNFAVNSGAGICITEQGGTLDIKRSTISGHVSSFIDPESVDYGGGLAINAGTTTIVNSTISGNDSSSLGGGIWANGGTVDIKHSTIADNTTGSYGGGVRQASTSVVSVYHTIIADNSAGTNGDDYYGTLDSDGYNLLEDTSGATITGTTTGNIYNTDPLLDVLAYNGGLTQTHKLLSNSPAIDTGDSSISNPPTTDQRGRLRLFDGTDDGIVRIDIGAYETGINVVVNADSTGGNGINNTLDDHFEVTRNGNNIEVSIESTLSRSIPFNWLDSLIINGSNDDDTVTINNLGSDFIGSITANAGSGTDTFVIYDSADDDELIIDPDAGTTTMHYDYTENSVVEIIANAFETVTAYSPNGGRDVAHLYDLASNDKFEATPFAATMDYGSDTNIDVTVNSFELARGYADNGGVDQAYLYDSTGDDLLYSTPTFSKLSGDNFYSSVSNFDRVIATANNGGDDVATLKDSAGDDTFVAGPGYGTFSNDGVFYTQVDGFEFIQAYGNEGGSDSATIKDSAGDDIFVSGPGFSKMTGVGFTVQVDSFEHVNGYGNGGGNDRAELHASRGDDHFIGTTNYGTMSGTGFDNSAYYFEELKAYSTGGGTATAELYDSMDPILESGMTVTGYWKGIIGVVIEADLPAGAIIDATDFDFSVYNATTSTWDTGPDPDNIIIHPDAGSGGTDQIAFSWDDDSIVDQWLDITVLASGDVGVANDETLYFGSLKGDATGDASVDSSDLGILASNYGLTGDFGISGADFNLDGTVDSSDLGVLSTNYGISLPSLGLTSSTAIDGYLYHRYTGDDTFTAEDGEASMDFGSDASLDIFTYGFAIVQAYSTGGTDRANLFDSTGNDTFNVGIDLATMDFGSDGVNVTANAFDEIYANFGEGGTDTSNITGSTGDDDLSTTSSSLTVDFDPSIFALDLVLSGLGADDTVNADGNGGDDDDTTGTELFDLYLTDWA